MEAKLNIAEILKYKPEGTKLHSPLFGKCTFLKIYDSLIYILHHNNTVSTFYSNGTYFKFSEAEPLLFPSKEMCDWSKFAWKKGDVLISNNGKREVLFKTWANDSYTKFIGYHSLITYSDEEVEYDNSRSVFNTNDFIGIEAEGAVKTYINTIEERLGGKLNLETLEIEKAQPEFKDGDIVTQGVLEGVNVYIIKNCTDKVDNKYNYYARYNSQKKKINYDDWSHISPFAKFATDSEKQQLFDALAKEGKAWDAEKKQIVNLKPKWTPKPFDRVITRVDDDAIWTANIFSHIDQYGEYVTIGCESGYPYCLPYNEETAKLIGTTKDVED